MRAVALLLIVGLAVLAVLLPVIAATFAPGLLLFAFLARGVQPGERLIERLRRRGETRPRTVVRSIVSPRLPLVLRPVGRTMAAALAMRPPPLWQAALTV